MIPDLTRPVRESRQENWSNRLGTHKQRLADPPGLVVEGKLNRMVGLTLEAVGCHAPIGARCIVDSPGSSPIEAEVVGFADERLFLMPTSSVQGIRPNARVIPTERVYQAPVGKALLGRVIDGGGRPLDGKGPLHTTEKMPLTGRTINPLQRQPIEEPLDVGVCSINSLLTIGRGQRMGLFAGSGVGKSVLLGMMTRFTAADVIVVGLIGERGREVKEFINNILGAAGLARSVVIAVPSDHTPVMRMHGASMCTTVAEYYRDQGQHVLLLMDSLTRYAQAQREIALAIGEPPATKGYPPSVFAKLPQLVERAGNGDKGGGSITAIYTILTEGDDQQDPIADAARAILDGHIVLSRELAEAGHYPAIDIEASISRTMTEIVSDEQMHLAQRCRHINSIFRQNEDLISVGAYTPGTDSRIDEAINFYPQLMNFLQQDLHTATDWQASLSGLLELFQKHEAAQQAVIETNTQMEMVNHGQA